MLPTVSHANSTPKTLERVIVFIDGGYIRQLFLDLFNDDNLNLTNLSRDLIKWYNGFPQK